MYSKALLMFALGVVLLNSAVSAANWPGWLGSNRDGISTEKKTGEFLQMPYSSGSAL